MNSIEPPRRLPRSRIILMVAIDLVALAIGIALYIWFKPLDQDAATLGLVAALVFGGFFNLVIALVTLKP